MPDYRMLKHKKPFIALCLSLVMLAFIAAGSFVIAETPGTGSGGGQWGDGYNDNPDGNYGDDQNDVGERELRDIPAIQERVNDQPHKRVQHPLDGVYEEKRAQIQTFPDVTAAIEGDPTNPKIFKTTRARERGYTVPLTLNSGGVSLSVEVECTGFGDNFGWEKVDGSVVGACATPSDPEVVITPQDCDSMPSGSKDYCVYSSSGQFVIPNEDGVTSSGSLVPTGDTNDDMYRLPPGAEGFLRHNPYGAVVWLRNKTSKNVVVPSGPAGTFSDFEYFLEHSSDIDFVPSCAPATFELCPPAASVVNASCGSIDGMTVSALSDVQGTSACEFGTLIGSVTVENPAPGMLDFEKYTWTCDAPQASGTDATCTAYRDLSAPAVASCGHIGVNASNPVDNASLLSDPCPGTGTIANSTISRTLSATEQSNLPLTYQVTWDCMGGDNSDNADDALGCSAHILKENDATCNTSCATSFANWGAFQSACGTTTALCGGLGSSILGAGSNIPAFLNANRTVPDASQPSVEEVSYRCIPNHPSANAEDCLATIGTPVYQLCGAAATDSSLTFATRADLEAAELCTNGGAEIGFSEVSTGRFTWTCPDTPIGDSCEKELVAPPTCGPRHGEYIGSSADLCNVGATATRIPTQGDPLYRCQDDVTSVQSTQQCSVQLFSCPTPQLSASDLTIFQNEVRSGSAQTYCLGNGAYPTSNDSEIRIMGNRIRYACYLPAGMAGNTMASTATRYCYADYTAAIQCGPRDGEPWNASDALCDTGATATLTPSETSLDYQCEDDNDPTNLSGTCTTTKPECPSSRPSYTDYADFTDDSLNDVSSLCVDAVAVNAPSTTPTSSDTSFNYSCVDSEGNTSPSCVADYAEALIQPTCTSPTRAGGFQNVTQLQALDAADVCSTGSTPTFTDNGSGASFICTDDINATNVSSSCNVNYTSTNPTCGPRDGQPWDSSLDLCNNGFTSSEVVSETQLLYRCISDLDNSQISSQCVTRERVSPQCGGFDGGTVYENLTDKGATNNGYCFAGERENFSLRSSYASWTCKSDDYPSTQKNCIMYRGYKPDCGDLENLGRIPTGAEFNSLEKCKATYPLSGNDYAYYLENTPMSTSTSGSTTTASWTCQIYADDFVNSRFLVGSTSCSVEGSTPYTPPGSYCEYTGSYEEVDAQNNNGNPTSVDSIRDVLFVVETYNDNDETILFDNSDYFENANISHLGVIRSATLNAYADLLDYEVANNGERKINLINLRTDDLSPVFDMHDGISNLSTTKYCGADPSTHQTVCTTNGWDDLDRLKAIRFSLNSGNVDVSTIISDYLEYVDPADDENPYVTAQSLSENYVTTIKDGILLDAGEKLKAYATYSTSVQDEHSVNYKGPSQGTTSNHVMGRLADYLSTYNEPITVILVSMNLEDDGNPNDLGTFKIFDLPDLINNQGKDIKFHHFNVGNFAPVGNPDGLYGYEGRPPSYQDLVDAIDNAIYGCTGDTYTPPDPASLACNSTLNNTTYNKDRGAYQLVTNHLMCRDSVLVDLAIEKDPSPSLFTWGCLSNDGEDYRGCDTGVLPMPCGTNPFSDECSDYVFPYTKPNLFRENPDFCGTLNGVSHINFNDWNEPGKLCKSHSTSSDLEFVTTNPGAYVPERRYEWTCSWYNVDQKCYSRTE